LFKIFIIILVNNLFFIVSDVLVNLDK
jgi:hypothetical protein